VSQTLEPRALFPHAAAAASKKQRRAKKEKSRGKEGELAGKTELREVARRRRMPSATRPPLPELGAATMPEEGAEHEEEDAAAGPRRRPCARTTPSTTQHGADSSLPRLVIAPNPSSPTPTGRPSMTPPFLPLSLL